MRFLILIMFICATITNSFTPNGKIVTILRKKIDFVDDRILDLFKLRFQMCKELGYYKNNTNLTVIERENEIISRLCEKYDDQEFIYDIWSIVFEKSKSIQK